MASLVVQIIVTLVFVLLGILPAGILSSIPLLFEPDNSDIVLVNGGLVQFGNLGNFIGALILAYLMLRMGWASVGFYVISGALIMLLGLFNLQRIVLQVKT